MEIKRLRVQEIETFKTVDNLNLNYMRDIFTPKLHLHHKVRPNDVLVKHHNIITYSTKSLKTLGPKIWNQLPGKKIKQLFRNVKFYQRFAKNSFLSHLQSFYKKFKSIVGNVNLTALSATKKTFFTE